MACARRWAAADEAYRAAALPVADAAPRELCEALFARVWAAVERAFDWHEATQRWLAK